MDSDGLINYEEFLAWVFGEDAQEQAQEEEVVAPFLRQAFGLMTNTITDLTTAATMSKNEDAMRRQFVELLGKTFDDHDTSGTGALEPAEAKIFCSNLVSESGVFMEAFTTISMRKQIEGTINKLVQSMSAAGLDAGTKMTLI